MPSLVWQPGRVTDEPRTGLTYLGVSQSSDFVLVDVDARTTTKLPVRLAYDHHPGDVWPMQGWTAIGSSGLLWATSSDFSETPRPLAETFTTVPRADASTMWVDPSSDGRSGEVVAVDAQGVAAFGWTLPDGWTHLVAELDSAMLVTRSSMLGYEDGTGVHELGATVGVLDHRGDVVAWAQRDESYHFLFSRRLVISDVGTGAQSTIELPQIEEWHRCGSIDPSEKRLVVLGYIDPNPRPRVREQRAVSATRGLEGIQVREPRRSVAVVVELETGRASIATGSFLESGSKPVWSIDGRWAVFCPYDDQRCLFAVDTAAMVLHRLAFSGEPPLPLIAVDGAHLLASQPVAVAEPQTRSEFIEGLRAAGLGAFEQQLVSLDRPSYRLRAAPAPSSTDVAATRLGGRPDLAPDVDWPRRSNGSPLAFLAQIGLGDLPEIEGASLPADGLLSFFYDVASFVGGFDPDDGDAWRVLWQSPDALLEPRPFPDDLGEEHRFAPVWQVAEIENTNVPWESSDIDVVALAPDQLFAYADVPVAVSGIAHRLLGHPDLLQGDMQLGCQLVTNGIPLDRQGYRDPRVEELREGATEWRLLLQIDSDDDAAMMWGDGGRLYFWIREKDLAGRRWDQAWFAMQCY